MTESLHDAAVTLDCLHCVHLAGAFKVSFAIYAEFGD